MTGFHSHDDDFLYEFQRSPNDQPLPSRRSRTECPTEIAPIVPRLLRIPDAARYLSATNWFVENLLREGIVPSLMLGKRKVVDVRDLDAFIDRLKSHGS